MVLERILSGLRGAEKARGDSFLQLARDIVAGGKEAKIAPVEEVLAEAGKTPADLAALVARLQKRAALAETIALAARSRSETEPLQERIRKADAIWEAADIAHTEAVTPCLRRLREIEHAQGDADTARQTLLLSCVDQELADSYKSLTAQLSQARGVLFKMRGRLGADLASIMEIEPEATNEARAWKGAKQGLVFVGSTRREVLEERLASARFRVAESEKEMPVLEKSISELEAKIADLEKQMMIP